MRGKKEVIYNKALCYNRSDISSAIEEGKSIRIKVIQDFYNNVLEYERTGDETEERERGTGGDQFEDAEPLGERWLLRW